MQNVSRFFDLFTLFAYFSRVWLSKVPKTHVQLRTICTICTKNGCLSSFFNHRAVSPLLSSSHSLPCPYYLMRYSYAIPMLFERLSSAYASPMLQRQFVKRQGSLDLLLYSFRFLLIFHILIWNFILAANHGEPDYSCIVFLSFDVAHSCVA